LDGLGRQSVDLLRQSRSVQRDLPASILLLARLPDSLCLLLFNHDRRGERAAILRECPCWNKSCVRRAGRNLSRTARQNQQGCDTQKGMRTSTSLRR